MVTMMEMLESVKETIKELEAKEKQNIKIIKGLTEENEQIRENLIMYKKILDNLNGIREDELEKALGENSAPKKEEMLDSKKRRGPNGQRKLVAIDERKTIIAEYSSVKEAGEDLHMTPAGIICRIKRTSVEKQIEKFGYALVYAE